MNNINTLTAELLRGNSTGLYYNFAVAGAKIWNSLTVDPTTPLSVTAYIRT